MLCSSSVLHGVHGASVYCSSWCWIRIWLEIWLLCWCVGHAQAKATLDIQCSGLIQSKEKRGFPDWQLYFDSFFGRSSFSNSLCTKDQLLLGRAGVCLSGTSRLWTLLLRIAREDTTASQHQGLRLLNQMVCLLGTLGGGFRGAGFRVVFLLECMLIWSVLSDCNEIMEDVVNVRTKLQCENAKLIARPFLAPWGRKKKQDSGSNKN